MLNGKLSPLEKTKPIEDVYRPGLLLSLQDIIFFPSKKEEIC